MGDTSMSQSLTPEMEKKEKKTKTKSASSTARTDKKSAASRSTKMSAVASEAASSSAKKPKPSKPRKDPGEKPVLKDNMTDLERSRQQRIAKRNDMIQQSRKTLTLLENKAVSYVLSKVKPGDTPDTVYRFDCHEFYQLMRQNRESYSDLRAMLYSLASQTWGIVDESGTEKIVHWFSTIHLKSDQNGRIFSDSDLPSRYIEIKIHEDIMPYIFNLDEQKKVNGIFYTSYRLDYVSLMEHIYSQTLYELLKSYENMGTWTFEYGTGTENDICIRVATYQEVKEEEPQSNLSPNAKNRPKRTNAIPKFVPFIPKSWSSFHFFERDVLKPGKEEINKYTDILIDYFPSKVDIHGIKRRKFCSVRFVIKKKTAEQSQATQEVINQAYEPFDQQQRFKQLTLDDIMMPTVAEADKQAAAIRGNTGQVPVEEEIKETTVGNAKYQIAASVFYDDFKQSEIVNLIDEAIKHIDFKRVAFKDREMWAIDYVSHYYDLIRYTPEDTKSTPYRRLLDCLRKDYDDFAESICQYDKVQGPQEFIPGVDFPYPGTPITEPEPIDVQFTDEGFPDETEQPLDAQFGQEPFVEGTADGTEFKASDDTEDEQDQIELEDIEEEIARLQRLREKKLSQAKKAKKKDGNT